jgi:hypothetical protein
VGSVASDSDKIRLLGQALFYTLSAVVQLQRAVLQIRYAKALSWNEDENKKLNEASENSIAAVQDAIRRLNELVDDRQ